MDQAVQRLRQDETVTIEGATIDLGRAARCRFGEVIYGEGKSTKLILDIAKELIANGQAVFITRLAAQNADEIASHFEYSFYHPEARTMRIFGSEISQASMDGAENTTSDFEPVWRHRVVVVTAGSTDGHVAAEACQTLGWMGVATELICDVGVAGPQRLLAVVPRLRSAAVVVVVAGMEAALASVVGGHVACPVIAVPTSVGYGTSFGGVTALMGMLSSCASNVTVVGIDAGFKGGYVAGLIATQLDDLYRESVLAKS